MDRYEYRSKMEQIERAKEIGDYQAAGKIAETIDWSRVKRVAVLCDIADIYDRVGRFEDSKDILLLAYERSPIGRMIVYRLCDVSIKLREMDDAKEYFNSYLELAPSDSHKYILQYKIEKALGASIDKLINILENLKNRELLENWAYELAYLYHKNGMATQCVDECNEIFLWFGEGKYVEKALELKMLYEPLTQVQKERYEYSRAKRIQETKRANRKVADFEPKVPAEEEPNVISPVEVNVGIYNTVNLQKELAKNLEQIINATEKDDVTKSMDKVKELVEGSKIPELQFKEEEPKATEEQDVPEASLDIDFKNFLSQENDGQLSLLVPEEPVVEQQITGQMSIEDVLAEWEKTKRAAEQALEADSARRFENAKAEAIAKTEGIISKLDQVIPQYEADAKARIAEIEKYHAEEQELLAQPYEEEAEEIIPEPVTEAIYEEEKPEAEGQVEEQVEERVEEQVEEPAEEQVEEPVEEQVEEPAEDPAAARRRIEEEERRAAIAEMEERRKAELEELQRAEEEKRRRIEEERMKLADEESKRQEALRAAELEKVLQEELGSDYSKETTWAEAQNEEVVDAMKAGTGKIEAHIKNETAKLPPIKITEYVLSPQQRDEFSYFMNVKGVEDQVCKLMCNLKNDAVEGFTGRSNIIVSGAPGMGKTKFAMSLVKVMQQAGLKKSGKFGKIKAEKLNEKNVQDLFDKLDGGCLVIEKATHMTAEKAAELKTVMDKKIYEEVTVILEDAPNTLSKFIANNFDLAAKFTNHVSIPIFNNDELIGFAKSYAAEQGYTIDEMGILAMYNRIGLMQYSKQDTMLEEVMEIVDDAIRKASSGFGRRFGRKKENILMEKDFT